MNRQDSFGGVIINSPSRGKSDFKGQTPGLLYMKIWVGDNELDDVEVMLGATKGLFFPLKVFSIKEFKTAWWTPEYVTTKLIVNKYLSNWLNSKLSI